MIVERAPPFRLEVTIHTPPVGYYNSEYGSTRTSHLIHIMAAHGGKPFAAAPS